MGPEGGVPSSVETGAPVGSTVGTGEAVAPAFEASQEAGLESGLNALEERVGALQFAQTEGTSDVHAAGHSIVQSTGAEGFGQGQAAGIEALGQDQGTEAQVLTGEQKQKLTSEAEAHAPTQEVPKIPERVANDPVFRQTYGELFAKEVQGGEADAAKIDAKITPQAVSEYYDTWAKTQIEKGLPEAIKNDPLYQQELGKALTTAQEKGEPLDSNKLSQEALAKYQQEKDLQAEKALEPGVEQIKTTEQRLRDLEDRMSVLEKVGQRTELDQLTLSMRDILPAIKVLLEAEQKREQDPKKKESLLNLLLKIVGLLAAAALVEGGKQAEQEVTRQTR